MPTAAAAHNLRDLHALHQRAKAIRDRLASGPKVLAARETALAKKQAELETARKAVMDAKSQIHKKETQLKGMQEKTSELRVKLNAIKKQVEYDAIRNQLANDNLAQSKLSEEILETMIKADDQAAAVAAQEAEVKKLAAEIAAMKADIASKAAEQKTSLDSLEAAIIEAEVFIAEDMREQYRRNITQRGADALAPVEGGACSGCYVSVTAQMMNELINGHHIVFCKTCGRILYLPEETVSATRRTGR
ncbi:MAG: Zn-ribbon protein nucleic acid-binding protein [Planctomycetota bacterium]|nr:Zn-ribbon protein nucleic acid-binding protein [Planctomycetota bacterium]